MKVEFVNPFITAAVKVLIDEASAFATKGKLGVDAGDFKSQETTVIISVTGEIEGHVFYNMTNETALQLISQMMKEKVTDFDSIAKSAIAELGNIISGNASAGLTSAGYPCRLSPPTVITQKNTPVSTLRIPRIVVPLVTQYGNIDIHVALREHIERPK